MPERKDKVIQVDIEPPSDRNKPRAVTILRRYRDAISGKVYETTQRAIDLGQGKQSALAHDGPEVKVEE